MANPSAGDDWFELYNSGSLPVPLGGLFITDDLTDRSRFHIAPLSFLGNGTNAFVRIEADSSPEKGARHAGFNLSAHGEEIGLYAADGSPIDTVVFGPQLTDVSEGRLPDGSPSIAALPAPSPGASNSGFAPGDSDGDGLPDEWEQAHFGNLLRDGSGDFDGDGLTDRQEYIAGTDPASSADYLRIEALTVSAGASTLSFEAVSGRTYQVEYTSDLSAGAWQVLSEQTASTTGRVQVSDSAPHAGARFYRIKVH
jgi:hypothetical protein